MIEKSILFHYGRAEAKTLSLMTLSLSHPPREFTKTNNPFSTSLAPMRAPRQKQKPVLSSARESGGRSRFCIWEPLKCSKSVICLVLWDSVLRSLILHRSSSKTGRLHNHSNPISFFPDGKLKLLQFNFSCNVHCICLTAPNAKNILDFKL